MGEEPFQREPPNFVDSHGFETLPRYFCLVDTREIVSLAEPQFSRQQNGSGGTCPSRCWRLREAMLGEATPLPRVAEPYSGAVTLSQLPQKSWYPLFCPRQADSPDTVNMLCLTKWGFPGGAVVKNPPANAGDTRDTSLIPG